MRAIVYDVKALGWVTCRWLRMLWPGCLVSGLNGVSLREIATPELPGEDWVLVRTRLGGICGTDISLLQQKQPADSILQAYGSMPMLLGHENVGEVAEVGEKVDRGWIGKRVCVEPTLSCAVRGIAPQCPRCEAGEFGACENFGAAGEGTSKLPAGTSIGYNRQTGGSYGEYFAAHGSQLVEVPAEIPDEQAVLTDPAACGVHAVLRADLRNAKHVLVYGSGAIGLSAAAGLRAAGYEGRIDILGRGRKAKELVSRMKQVEWISPPNSQNERFSYIAQRTGGRVQRVRFGNRMLDGGYDIVIHCLGSGRSLEESLKWTRARGQVVLAGTGHGGGADLTPIWCRELQVIGAYGRQQEYIAGGRIGTYELVLQWMAEGKLDLRGYLTHRFGLEEYRKAFQIAMHKSRYDAVKVCFDFRS